MIAESLVGVLALIAACSLYPGDYFAINTTPAVFSHLGPERRSIWICLLPRSRRETGGKAREARFRWLSAWRKSSAACPGMDRLMGYWYHYAIMFEALFILTTSRHGDPRGPLRSAGTHGQGATSHSATMPGCREISITSFFVVLGWGYLIYTGNISTIWPLFGTGNQLLATIALAVTTTFLINMGKRKYAWITGRSHVLRRVSLRLRPECSSIKNIFWPLDLQARSGIRTGYLDSDADDHLYRWA
jgi:carbon starvation protein